MAHPVDARCHSSADAVTHTGTSTQPVFPNTTRHGRLHHRVRQNRVSVRVVPPCAWPRRRRVTAPATVPAHSPGGSRCRAVASRPDSTRRAGRSPIRLCLAHRARPPFWLVSARGARPPFWLRPCTWCVFAPVPDRVARVRRRRYRREPVASNAPAPPYGMPQTPVVRENRRDRPPHLSRSRGLRFTVADQPEAPFFAGSPSSCLRGWSDRSGGWSPSRPGTGWRS